MLRRACTSLPGHVLLKRCTRSLIGEEKAIRVPFVKNNKVPLQAFSHHSEVRHALVEEGFRIVGEAAWRSCHRLQIVHLPDTVVSLRRGAFCRCYVLREVTAPGCRHFGTKVFEQCRSLTQIGTTLHSDELLAPQAQLRSWAFELRQDRVRVCATTQELA